MNFRMRRMWKSTSDSSFLGTIFRTGQSTMRVGLAATAVVAFLFVLTPESADARLGGGNSYSGGGGGGGRGYSGGSSSYSGSGGFSGGSSYSGGGNSGSSSGWQVAILCTSVAIWPVLWIFSMIKDSQVPEHVRRHVDQSRGSTSGTRRSNKNSLQQMLGRLYREDPNFSETLFLDFVCSLYSQVHEARGRGDVARFAAYLTGGARKKIAGDNRAGNLTDVKGVIVGSVSIKQISWGQFNSRPGVAILVELETNYTEVSSKSGENSWYCREQWKFFRAQKVLSKPPETIIDLSCPNCGSALENTSTNKCRSCGQTKLAGRFQWCVYQVKRLARESRGPLLTSDVPEAGTQLLTLYHPEFRLRRAKFEGDNPAFSWSRTQDRFRAIFVALQEAWSTCNWELARPHETDSLFQSHRYWIEEYKRQNLKNVLEGMTVRGVEPVKIASDAFYDAITVRVFASSKDYTVRGDGYVVCGNRETIRNFTEYWTFIRRRGVQEGTRSPTQCPNCGAELKINMAGVCEYCESKITRGDFDWVLSRIEQDESYNDGVALPNVTDSHVVPEFQKFLQNLN